VDTLQQFLWSVDLPGPDELVGQWYVDVGMELVSQDLQCLQWSTPGHYFAVRDVLSISSEDASRITKLSSSKYSRDVVSHLMGVSGCRIEPGTRAQGPYEAVYLQLYTTDKALTYNPEGRHHGKAITTKLAMGQTQPADFINGLTHLYTNAMTRNASNARVEVRVPVHHATRVLSNSLSTDVITSLLSFQRSVWWNFRLIRTEAISRVLMQQQIGEGSLRVKPDALLLTAACVWLLNSLHSRPDDGSAGRSLMRAVLPLTDADNPDPNTVLFLSRESDDEDVELTELPYIAHGTIFLRRLMLDVEVPRMRVHPTGIYLSKSAFRYFFEATEEDVRYTYNPQGIAPRGPGVRPAHNRSIRTPTFVATGDTNEVLFDFASRGHFLPPPVEDDGSDVEEPEEGVANLSISGDINSTVTQMWGQFLIDIVLKSPGPKRNAEPPYLTLTFPERQAVKEDLYMNLRLSDMWRMCRWKIAT
ncbi:hypothetical protein EV361DRAFT_874802, partial [Lentinula raphanica]